MLCSCVCGGEVYGSDLQQVADSGSAGRILSSIPLAPSVLIIFFFLGKMFFTCAGWRRRGHPGGGEAMLNATIRRSCKCWWCRLAGHPARWRRLAGCPPRCRLRCRVYRADGYYENMTTPPPPPPPPECHQYGWRSARRFPAFSLCAADVPSPRGPGGLVLALRAARVYALPDKFSAQ